MLGEYALEYYNQGSGCGQCIIMAAEKVYGIKSCKGIENAMRGISNGLGVGSVCSVPVACIMVIALVCEDEAEMKMKRLMFMERFKKSLGSYDCGTLQKKAECYELIKKGCDILEKIV